MRTAITSLCLFVAVMLQGVNNAAAIPHLQLSIPTTGAFYNYSNSNYTPDTWAYSGNAFDLQVVSAIETHNPVYVSIALLGGASADLSSVNIVFDGTPYTSGNFTWGKPYNMGQHDVYNAYYVEIPVGSFGIGTKVCNVEPGFETDCSDPALSQPGGEIKNFSVLLQSNTPLHFDVYTLKTKKGETIINERNPFSHDAEAEADADADAEAIPTPEPATIALLCIGIVGVIGYKGRRYLRRS